MPPPNEKFGARKSSETAGSKKKRLSVKRVLHVFFLAATAIPPHPPGVEGGGGVCQAVAENGSLCNCFILKKIVSCLLAYFLTCSHMHHFVCAEYAIQNTSHRLCPKNASSLPKRAPEDMPLYQYSPFYRQASTKGEIKKNAAKPAAMIWSSAPSHIHGDAIRKT